MADPLPTSHSAQNLQYNFIRGVNSAGKKRSEIARIAENEELGAFPRDRPQRCPFGFTLHLAAADNGLLRSKKFFAADRAQRRSNPKLDCLGTGANQRFVSGKETDNPNATGTTQREDLLQVLQVPELD